MNLWQTLLRPDQDENPERGLVVHAANLLQIGEFQLLQLAFAHWYGREMTEGEISAIFHSFMIRSQVPPWARHYAREIIEQESQGKLDAGAAAYHRYDCEGVRTPLPHGVRRFLVATTLIAGLLGGSIAMASYTVEKTGKCTDELPPCFTRQELGGR